MSGLLRCRTIRTKRRPPHSGFTLAELVLSMAIMSILMTGLASAILIASHALPDEGSVGSTVVESAGVADQIVEELRAAIWIREHTATAVSFTVPDRDGDAVPERIRYAWSGTPGDPLTRQYNGGSVVQVLADVYEFDLAYELRTVTEEYAGPGIESAEILLASYVDFYFSYSYVIDAQHWIGQYFRPSLPADATSWRVTRVQFRGRIEGLANANTLVQLRPADTDRKPTDQVLEEVIVPESMLGDFATWQDVEFHNVPGLAPGAGLCLVLKYGGGSGTCSAAISYEASAGSARLTTGDAGANWNYDSDKSMYYCAYGTYTTPGPPQTATRQYVTGVGIVLRAGKDPALRVVTRAQTLNTPELLSGLWEADFDSDPTLDLNGDGGPDWLVHGGGIFAAASLDNGIWHAYAQLDSSPDHNFTRLTTVDVSFRNTTVIGSAAVFTINVDWSDATCAPIIASLERQPDDTQTLTVCHKLDSMTRVPLITVPGLPNDFARMRLLVDPDLDTVNVQVNKQEYGTYVYNKIVPPTDSRFATIGVVGSGADFDYVSIRVSE